MKPQELKVETENEIKFNKSYQALYRQLQVTYTKLGATDFYGVVGEKFDARRHQKVNMYCIARRRDGSHRYTIVHARIVYVFQVVCTDDNVSPIVARHCSTLGEGSP